MGRKTKTKAIILTNHTDSSVNQSEFEVISDMQPAPSAGNFARATTDWFLVLLLIGWESGASFVNQSQGEVEQNQIKGELPSTHN